MVVSANDISLASYDLEARKFLDEVETEYRALKTMGDLRNTLQAAV